MGRERPPLYVNVKTLAAEMEISETQVYALVRQGVLPRPIKLSERCVRWAWSSVEAALASLEEGRQPDEDDSDPFMKAIRDAKKETQGARATA